MGYSAEQKRVIQEIVGIGKKRGESKKEIKSALLTGRTETNFSNPKVATDHDSLGWRQERQMYYKDPANLRASINRYYDETTKAGDGRGMKSWELSQKVQRSAFPGRYKSGNKEAEKILRGGVTPVARTAAAPEGVNTEVLDVVSRPGKINATDLAVAVLAGESATAPAKTTKTVKTGHVGGSSPARAVQNVTHGVGMKGITMTSAKRGRVKTASGNVSDHYTGNKNAHAEDYGGSVSSMDSFARNVAKQLGIKGYKPGQIYNVNRNGYRYQLIYGTSDHKDHVHLGAKKL